MCYFDFVKDVEKYVLFLMFGWDCVYCSGDLVCYELVGLVF